MSKDNKKIKYVKKLVCNGNFLKKEKNFVVEGFRLCKDAYLNNVIIKELYYTDDAIKKFSDKLEEIINYAKNSYKISEDILKSISATKTPQGILCVCEKLDKHFSMNTINNVGKFILLENIQDPANMGTILRTSEALGINFVVLSSGCCDIYNAKVLRASMGAIFRVNVLFCDDICKVIKDLQGKNIKTYATVPDSSAKSILDVDLKENAAVVIGNEGNGLSQSVIEVCDEKITIPMLSCAESLNAAMAAGIFMWEMMRGSRE